MVSAGTGGQMSYTKKAFEELDVMDDFLMNAVAADAEIGEDFCRNLLAGLLQRNIGKIRIVAQCTIPAVTPEHRGIRMDVEIEEEREETLGELPALNLYDLEPHLRKEVSLPRHNRFYQAKIDSRYLKSGETDFSGLPNLYVITILNYDPFGYDYMLYTVRNHCEELRELEYEDGLEFLYFNTSGSKGGSEKLKNLLRYMQDSREENVTDDVIREIHSCVSRVKMQPEVRLEYMRYDEIIAWERKDAAEEAKKEATKETTRIDIMELLKDYGDIPDSLREKIEKEDSLEILRKWLKLAARSTGLEEFERKLL